ncbi:LexA-binding, inner membrane-associated putative hydrolase [Kordia sp. SMS9]|uniref:metal-dependent hydrolase n=1 Tax=Kordia sp. SMS9 TaxID=2282170 RepID=UPI000E0CF9DD|nr:metal-dependent hydrolase [Kordia sp. SMS9]AXG70837.1 LexA-binding, inner membrane-associated putative hydrolase [Kordia sp. SMS9]
MDSLTQIVLGAACGEAAMGKKIGNKALLFGAIGGTIPDLDVFLGNLFYSNKIDAMLFHRGFMHSMLFAILAAFLVGFLVFKLYDKGKRKGTTTRKDWTWLFFLSIFTHPLLDCFTGYGTQLFLPFSDYRVAFSNISVADPAYTLPFLICLIVLMFYKRRSPKRKLWLKLGVGISSVYMLFTIGNKFYINSVFEKSLAVQGIDYQRYNTEASILNNILWYGIAETETDFHVAFYSLFDTKDVFTDWKTIPKNHELLPKTNSDLACLAWFSNNYYMIEKNEDGTFTYSDLRYPSVNTGDGKPVVFSFKIFKDGDRLNMKPFQGPRFDEDTSLSDVFGIFWKRIKGK